MAQTDPLRELVGLPDDETIVIRRERAQRVRRSLDGEFERMGGALEQIERI